MEDKEYRRPENTEKKNVWSKVFAVAGSIALAILTILVVNL